VVERIVYVDGHFLPESEAKVSVFDRGFLFADGVYEVTTVIGGKLIDFPGHQQRLRRSLSEIDIAFAMLDAELERIHREILARNALEEGLIYLQVTRGAADRDFVFPVNVRPTVVLFTQARAVVDTAAARHGLRVITVPDLRWARRDIKTIQLLPSSLSKMMAKHAGKDDAWMVEDGMITEGSSNNAYIVTAEGGIVTRGLSTAILPGITRATLLEYARASGRPIEERLFSVDEAYAAAEAFITSATTLVTPVVEIDERPIGSGQPGPVTRQLRQLYLEESLRWAR
jgi:D-alanine transaminase